MGRSPRSPTRGGGPLSSGCSPRASLALAMSRRRLPVNTVMDGALARTYLLAYAAPKTTDGKPDQKIIDAVTPAVRVQLEVLDEAVANTG
jgi:hypothetical protein